MGLWLPRDEVHAALLNQPFDHPFCLFRWVDFGVGDDFAEKHRRECSEENAPPQGRGTWSARPVFNRLARTSTSAGLLVQLGARG